MNLDPSINIVAFKPRRGAALVASAPTRDEDCIQQAWEIVQSEHRVRAFDVVAIETEWEPSGHDALFMRQTFSNLEESACNFQRPTTPDGWEAAFEEARRTIDEGMSRVVEEESQKQPDEGYSQMSRDEALRRIAEKSAGQRDGFDPAAQMDHVDREGVLLPILRSATTFALTQVVPHQELTPGLSVALATVAMTPRGTIGMNHLTHHGLREMGSPSFADLLEFAGGNLRDGLQIEGRGTDEMGVFLRLHRDGKPFSMVSAAVALPDFHETMTEQLETDRLIAAIPCPDELYVAAADSPWAEMLKDMVHSSEYPDTEVVPSLLSLDSSGIELLAERPQRA